MNFNKEKFIKVYRKLLKATLKEKNMKKIMLMLMLCLSAANCSTSKQIRENTYAQGTYEPELMNSSSPEDAREYDDVEITKQVDELIEETGLGKSLAETTENLMKTAEEFEIPMSEKRAEVISIEQLKDEEQLDQLLEYMIGENPFGIKFMNKDQALNYLYETTERTINFKILISMVRYGLSYEEFNTVLACVCAESCADDYYDAYAVANAMFNRIYDVSLLRQYGENLFNHVKAPGQFTVYAGNCYQKYLGKTDYINYQAGVDMFYSKILLHDYLEFRSNGSNLSNYRQFSKRGNKFKFIYCTPVNDEYNKLKKVEDVEELDDALEQFYNREELEKILQKSM